MKRRIAVAVLLVIVPVSSSTQAGFERRQVEREVMSVLDAFMEAFNRQDAQAEERTFHFPHYRLANGLMSSWVAPGAEVEAWMNGTYRTLRESGWDRSSWTRRRIVRISDAKAHIDTEITRYRNNGSVITKVDSLYVLTDEAGRWGIKMRSSLDTVIAAPGEKRDAR